MSDRETTREREAAGTGEAYDSEIGFGLLVKLGVALLAIVVVAAVLMYLLFARFLDWEKAREPEPPVLVEARAPVLVPGAKLLAEPEGALRTYEARVTERLQGYGWVDEAQGTVHIPIDRAIEIMAERGFPGRAEAAPEPDAMREGHEPGEDETPRIDAAPEPGRGESPEDVEAEDDAEAGSRPEDGA